MKIIIYDDISKEANNLREALDYCFNKLAINVSYDIFNKPIDNINYNDYDLVFLDIEINKLNGIEIGRKIRELNNDIPIIITTNYKKYAIDGYAIKADRYFLKPIDKEELYLELKYLLKDYVRDLKYFYDEKLSFDNIYLKDVLYVEILNRKTLVHIKDKRALESTKCLRDWLEIFDGYGFVQIHRAFIVNLKHIKAFNKEEVTMINGDVIPISRHFKHDFEDAYRRYVIRGI